MNINTFDDILKDAIIDSVSQEYFHRSGGETRHWLPTVELVLGGIVTAFLIPYAKKLAEHSADATWTRLKHINEEHSVVDKEFLQALAALLKGATPAQRELATSAAIDAARKAMQMDNFSDETQHRVIKSLLAEIDKLLKELVARGERYRVDPTLAATISRKVMLRRISLSPGRLAQSELDVLQFAVSRFGDLSPSEPTCFLQVVGEMLKSASHLYNESVIGASSFGAFLSLIYLGVAVSDRDDVHSAARISYKSVLVSAVFQPSGGTLSSLLVLYLKHVVKLGVGRAIARALESLERDCEMNARSMIDSLTIGEWLSRIAETFPYIDAQFVVYRCLISLVESQSLIESDLKSINGMTLETCRASLKKVEERLAYLYSPGLIQFKDFPDGCDRYVAHIHELAAREGAKVARRQAQYDLARWVIPRFLFKDATNQL